ncbi:hypothetical protein PMIN04_002961 [Paraphaeosphaeria minitans]
MRGNNEKFAVRMLGDVRGNHWLTVPGTFNAYITEEVFIRQPMKVYLNRQSNRRNHRLFRNGMHVFLEYRLDAVYGAHDLIPSVVRKTVGKLMEITEETSDSARAQLNKEVIAAITKIWNNIHVDAPNPYKQTVSACSKDTEDARLLCLAIGMGKPDRIKKVLEHCTSPWTSTHRMGYPFDVAVHVKDLRTVEILLKDQRFPKPKKAALFSAKINNYCHGDSDKALYEELISLHHKCLGRPRAGFCDRWFSIACLRGHMDIARKILDMGFTAKLADRYRDGSFMNMWLPQYRSMTLQLLLEKNVIDVANIYEFKGHMNNAFEILPTEVKSLLSYAVYHGYADVVRLALEAGADPNGAMTSTGTPEYPIIQAILRQSCEASILKHLLAHGADLEGDAGVVHEVVHAVVYTAGFESIVAGPEKRKMLHVALRRMRK